MFHTAILSTGKHRSSLGTMVAQSTVLLMMAIIALIVLLALLILFHQNTTATKGYKLRTLERERSRLLLEEEVIKMEVSQSQALEKIRTDRQIKAMIPVRGASYTSPDETVAWE